MLQPCINLHLTCPMQAEKTHAEEGTVPSCFIEVPPDLVCALRRVGSVAGVECMHPHMIVCS